MAGRILVIRGGAIGDFILTLPALGLLRDAFPEAHIEILGYKHIIALAERRFYADATRSIEYAPMAGFFNPKSDLDPELRAYFSGFDQVISYLYDPDAFFSENLKRAGVRNLITADPRLGGHAHAAQQLALPLRQLALFLADEGPCFFPSDTDMSDARRLLPPGARPLIAIHPGSGGKHKIWPIDRWQNLISRLLAERPAAHFLVVGGESDTQAIEALRRAFQNTERACFLESPPLPALGAAFALANLYVGHDSGISHLAAASGCPCVLLFGPTDPAVWAPRNEPVTILQSQTGSMGDIALESVLAVIDSVGIDA